MKKEREEARHQGQASIIIIVLIWKLHSPVRCAPSRPVSLESQPPSQHSRITRSMVTILQIKVRMMLIAPLTIQYSLYYRAAQSVFFPRNTVKTQPWFKHSHWLRDSRQQQHNRESVSLRNEPQPPFCFVTSWI